MSYYKDGPKEVYRGENIVIVSVESHLCDDDDEKDTKLNQNEGYALDFVQYLKDNDYHIIKGDSSEIDPDIIFEEYLTKKLSGMI